MKTLKKKTVCLKLFVWFVCAGIFLLAGGSSAQAGTGKLVVGLDNDVERLVPLQIRTPQTMPVSMQIYQGLFDLNEKGELIPVLVENYTTDDFKTWTFNVRKKVYFHTSSIFSSKTREMTAEDVVYSLKRFCSKDSFSSFMLIDSVMGAKEFNAGNADSVSGITYIDKYTFKIELIRPEPFFLHRISTAMISVFPEEMDAPDNEKSAGFSIAVGTGPYMLKSKTENEIVLVKNDQYWDEQNQAEIGQIVFKIIKNDQARYINLLKGNIDIMIVPTSLFPHVLTRTGELKDKIKTSFQKKVLSTNNIHFIGMNNVKVVDQNLRKAIFYGTDRQEIIDSVLYGYGQAMAGTVPEGMNGYPFLTVEKLYDPEKAAMFLKNSSYKGESLELIVHDAANSELIGQIFQAQMAAVGINIELKKLDFGGTVQKILSGDNTLFSMFFEYSFSSPEPLLINSFASSKIPVPNFISYRNPSVDKMLESLHTINDPLDSLKKCAEIERQVIEDAPAVYLYRQQYILLYPKDLKGLEISPNNHYYFEKIKAG